MKKYAAILLSGLWINASEFFRNEVLLKHVWETHYQSLGLSFASAPVNGALWVAWGFGFAAIISLVSRQINLRQSILTCWGVAFPLMWIVLWNLQVLPLMILPYAIPLSLLEVVVAVLICKKINPL